MVVALQRWFRRNRTLFQEKRSRREAEAAETVMSNKREERQEERQEEREEAASVSLGLPLYRHGHEILIVNKKGSTSPHVSFIEASSEASSDEDETEENPVSSSRARVSQQVRQDRHEDLHDRSDTEGRGSLTTSTSP